MNVGKSCRVCLAKQDKNIHWLADQIGLGYKQTSKIVKGEHEPDSERIGELAEAFEMNVVDFIKEGMQ